MLSQKLEEKYFKVHQLLGKEEYFCLLNDLSARATFVSKKKLLRTIELYAKQSEKVFNLMENSGFFKIEYSYSCDDEEMIDYIPEKPCEICEEKIENHEDYIKLFLISDDIKEEVSSVNNDTLVSIVGSGRGLLEEIRRNKRRLVPFLGAGISVPLGLPSWRTLIETISSNLSESSRIKIKDCLDKGDYLSCFDTIFSDSNNQQYKNLEMVKRELSSSFGKDAPNYHNDSNHKDVINLNCPLIFTTNYDSTLEHFTGDSFESVVFSQIEDIYSIKEQKSIVHLHGVAGPTTKKTLIVDKSDYNKLYEDQNLQRKLQSFLGDRAILFIGYSLDDYYFMNELMKISESNEGYVEYYAIFINADMEKLKTKLNFLDKIKVININIDFETEKTIIIEEKPFVNREKRMASEINDEITLKIRFLLNVIENKVYL